MQKAPKHIAIIMDGNGRWAKKKLMPRVFGHKAGVNAVKASIRACIKREVDILTLFAFSTENNARPTDEVRYLLNLFVESLDSQAQELHQNNVQLNIIGDYSFFSAKALKSIEKAKKLTEKNSGLILNIAINYSGRWDIQQAVVATQKHCLATGEIDMEGFEDSLCFSSWPDPDLLIRTSGEARISNFMLWNLAYTELCFLDVLWPDFSEEHINEAIGWFQSKERRYGKIAEQLQEDKNA